MEENKQNNAQTFERIDPKIGEVFDFKGMKLKAAQGNYSCDGCALFGFDKECAYPYCSASLRSDHRDAIFKLAKDDTDNEPADQPGTCGESEKYMGRYLGTFGDGYGAFNYVSAKVGDYILVCTVLKGVLKDIKFLHKYVYTNGSWLHAGMICGPTIATFGHSIPAELYDRLDYLGIIPNEVRNHNVGSSNYAEHTIQPWSVWLDYPELTSWDHDILKRVLRTKADNPRELDYEKIIQICQERLRQLKHKKQ